MTIKETMLEMYKDGVYGAAMLRDEAAAEAAIAQMEKYYADNPTDTGADIPAIFPGLPASELSYEQQLAKELRENLYLVALAAWCRGYTREQMVQLTNLLAAGEAGLTNTYVRICDGGADETIDSLVSAWNESNPEAEPIKRTDPDIG